MRLFKIIEQNPYIISLLILAGLIYWFGEALKNSEQVNTQMPKDTTEEVRSTQLPKVVTKTFESTTITDSVNAYGTSKPLEQANLRTKVSGEVVDVFKDKGDKVEENEVIAKIDSESMEAELEALKQTRQEIQLKLKVSKELYDEDYSSKVDVAEIYSSHKQINADIKKLQNSIDNTEIRAPISGQLDGFELKKGDFVSSGEKLGTINDLSKLVMSVDIPESHQQFLRVGKEAYIELSSNNTVSGEITYVSSVADPLSHTFNIEVTADNTKQQNVGASASVFILTERVEAYNISPALLALNPEGKEKPMGIKIIDENNRVKFTPVTIIKSSQDGLWVKTASEKIELIVSGHSYVQDGQKVKTQDLEDLKNASSVSKEVGTP